MFPPAFKTEQLVLEKRSFTDPVMTFLNNFTVIFLSRWIITWGQPPQHLLRGPVSRALVQGRWEESQGRRSEWGREKCRPLGLRGWCYSQHQPSGRGHVSNHVCRPVQQTSSLREPSVESTHLEPSVTLPSMFFIWLSVSQAKAEGDS